MEEKKFQFDHLKLDTKINKYEDGHELFVVSYKDGEDQRSIAQNFPDGWETMDRKELIIEVQSHTCSCVFAVMDGFLNDMNEKG